MDTISILATVLGIAGIAGGASGYFAKSRGETIISLQGKEIEYWKDRATQLEKDNAAITANRDALKQENQRLVRLAQGSPQLAKLAKEIKDLVIFLENGRGKNG